MIDFTWLIPPQTMHAKIHSVKKVKTKIGNWMDRLYSAHFTTIYDNYILKYSVNAFKTTFVVQSAA